MEIEVLPENWPAVELFGAMQTQWRIGMGGPTGLDYSALDAVEARLGIGKKKRQGLFAALRVMEGEALKVWSEGREK